MIAGIYKITCKVNNKSYIGISVDIFRRWGAHFENCQNEKLKKDIKKYGIENFEFEILDTPDKNNNLHHSEIYYIRTFNSIKHGYNIEAGSNYIHYDPKNDKFYL